MENIKTVESVRKLAKFDGVEYVEHLTPLEGSGNLVEVYKYEKGRRLKLSEYAEINGKRYEIEGYEAPGVLTVRVVTDEEDASDLGGAWEDDFTSSEEWDEVDDLDEVDEMSQAQEDEEAAALD